MIWLILIWLAFALFWFGVWSEQGVDPLLVSFFAVFWPCTLLIIAGAALRKFKRDRR